MAKIIRKSYENYEAQFPKLRIFIGQKSIFQHYYIQDIKDGIQIRVYTINKESVVHFASLFHLKVKKNLRKSQAQFREKLRKSRPIQKDGFLIVK